MQKQDLKDLINMICNEEYEHKTHNGEMFRTTIVSGYNYEERKALEKVVYEWGASLADEEKAKEIGLLKAKCYAYEQIIANSNFAPMIIGNDIPSDADKTQSAAGVCEVYR